MYCSQLCFQGRPYLLFDRDRGPERQTTSNDLWILEMAPRPERLEEIGLDPKGRRQIPSASTDPDTLLDHPITSG